MMTSKTTLLGQTVHYTLTEHDVAAISVLVPSINQAAGQNLNTPRPGDVYPAMVVRDWGAAVNLQVFLDGAACYWATSRVEGTEPGTWQRAA